MTAREGRAAFYLLLKERAAFYLLLAEAWGYGQGLLKSKHQAFSQPRQAAPSFSKQQSEGRLRRFRARAARAVSLVHRIIGAPDYDGYVAHATRCHPDRPLLSRDDFVRQRLEDRYSRPGSRCC